MYTRPLPFAQDARTKPLFHSMSERARMPTVKKRGSLRETGRGTRNPATADSRKLGRNPSDYCF
jgi:hypothetical protein